MAITQDPGLPLSTAPIASGDCSFPQWHVYQRKPPNDNPAADDFSPFA